MDLHRPGWLREFFSLLLGDYEPARAESRVGIGSGGVEALETPRIRARRHLALELRRSGLIYGSPKLPSRLTSGTRLDRAAAHFFSVLAGECFVALDVGRIYGISFDPEQAQATLSFLLAAGIGRVDLATSLAAELGATRQAPRGRVARWVSGGPMLLRGSARSNFDRLQERLEVALVERVALATGETVFDLPIHNSRIFGEARLIGHLAVDLREKGYFRPELAARLVDASFRERANLLPALVAPARLQRPPSDAERRTIARELRSLGVPRAWSRRLKIATEISPTPLDLASRIRTRTARRFALEQAWLASMIGGLDETEDRFLADLAAAFGFPEDALDSIEAEVADYFYDPDEIIDSFEIRAKAQESSGKLADRIERELTENLDRILLEVKETGELAQFLAKAAIGKKLTRDEREKAREQLIDLAKVVPSLAIFAAPGGMLILAALAKVLPFSLLPSSFHPPPEAAPRRPSRLPSRSRRPPRT